MRFFVAATFFAFCGQVFSQDALPSSVPKGMSSCNELAKQSNGTNSVVPVGKPKPIQFTDYPTRPVAPQRPHAAEISKYDVTEKNRFSQAALAVVSEGPDFAGRYAIVTWGCGWWCSNVLIADVVTGRVYEAPFAAVMGFTQITDGELIQRRADSSLLVVCGCLEMRDAQQSGAGPCGTFHFIWSANRLRLIGCEIKSQKPL